MTRRGSRRSDARLPRVLILSSWSSLSSMASGGGTQSDSALVAALANAGYHVDLLVPVNSEAERPGSAQAEGPTMVHRFRRPRVAPLGRLDPLAEWLALQARFLAHTLRDSQRNGRPDVIYAFGSEAVPAAAVAGVLLRRPTIGKLFGTFLYPVRENRRALLGQFPEALAFKSPVTRLVVHDDGTGGDVVARVLGVPQHRLRFWRNGVDKDACRRARCTDVRASLALPPHAPLLVSTCRHVQWKRVDRVIRLMPAVLGRAPTAVLVISGDGPERPALERLTEDLGVASSVRFTGALGRADNLSLIASADLYCSFYEYSNVSSALLEAMTCGVCVLVSDSGATGEIVCDGKTGVVVAEHDEAAREVAAVELLADESKRQRLADAAAAWADAALLSLDDRMDVEVSLVSELVASWGHRPTSPRR